MDKKTENSEEQQEKGRELAPYYAFCIYSGVVVVLALLGSITGWKLIAHMTGLSLLGLLVVTFMVLISKQWKSILLTLLTAPVLAYILYWLLFRGEF